MGVNAARTPGVDGKNETTSNLTLFIKWRVERGNVLSKIHQRVQSESAAGDRSGRNGGGARQAVCRQPADDLRMAAEAAGWSARRHVSSAGRTTENRDWRVGTQGRPTDHGKRVSKKNVAAVRAALSVGGGAGQEELFQQIEKARKAGDLSVTAMCRALSVSRAGFYRWQEQDRRSEQDCRLRDEIERIALAWPSYGSR